MTYADDYMAELRMSQQQREQHAAAQELLEKDRSERERRMRQAAEAQLATARRSRDDVQAAAARAEHFGRSVGSEPSAPTSGEGPLSSEDLDTVRKELSTRWTHLERLEERFARIVAIDDDRLHRGRRDVLYRLLLLLTAAVGSGTLIITYLDQASKGM